MGSKYVDVNFENFLKEFLGEKLFAVYQKNASMKIDILDVFELLKKNLIQRQLNIPDYN